MNPRFYINTYLKLPLTQARLLSLMLSLALALLLAGCVEFTGTTATNSPSGYSSSLPTRSQSDTAASVLDSKLRQTLNRPGSPSMYLGRCGFSEDLTSASIVFDSMVWFTIVSREDDTRGTYMSFFFKAVREAAIAAGGNSGAQPSFHLVNSDGSVMARGVIVGGNELPNFVDQQHWKNW